MATIGADAPRPRRVRVTLARLLAERDASIAATPRPWALAGLRAKRTARAASAALLTAVVALALFVGRHGLVVGGLAAFTLAALTYSTALALVVGGLGLLFLELRRR